MRLINSFNKSPPMDNKAPPTTKRCCFVANKYRREKT